MNAPGGIKAAVGRRGIKQCWEHRREGAPCHAPSKEKCQRDYGGRTHQNAEGNDVAVTVPKDFQDYAAKKKGNNLEAELWAGV